MFGILSERSREFYLIVTIILVIVYFFETDHKNLHNNLRSGLSRGIVTGFVLGGTDGIFPAASILAVLNVLTHYLESFVKSHLA
jgi:hypothetical protein